MPLRNNRLNQWAKAVVEREEDVVECGERLYPSGRVEVFDRVVKLSVCRSEIRDTTTAGDQVVDLRRHILPDGSYLDECVQTIRTNCYCNVFLALKDASGNWVPESLWSDKELACWSACYCSYSC